MKERTIEVGALARVEGEGALTIRYDGDEPKQIEFRIFEPPRFFEAFLVGRSALETPDITARICGICPVAYQMSACTAVEDAIGLQVEPGIHQLRRLLYCGEWIESHTLHMVMLHAPDFLGVPDATTMARSHGQQVRDGLRIKKAGNKIVSTLGGREIHPINVRIGGFYKLPDKAELDALLVELEACRGLAEGLVRWMAATFTFPELERDYELVCLKGPPYPFMDGPIVSNKGLSLPASDFDQAFYEEHVAHSNALHAKVHGRGAYLCGPQARFSLNFNHLPTEIQDIARDIGLAPPVLNPFRSLLVRGLEIVFALDEAMRIIRELERPDAPHVEPTLRAGVGHGTTEAPRGLLYHRYELDDDGLITKATIIPPTSQNQLSIEEDLWALAPALRTMSDEGATHRAEQAIRNYDPCISCATHFLTVKREQV